MTYRARQGIDPASVSLAVVVQQMVDAESAGVMFTANPANGRRDQVVISAAWGLGEAVVSGAVDTDNLVVAGGRRSISRNTAEKAIMTGTRTTGRRPPSSRCRSIGARRRCSTTTAARARRAGARIDGHFGAPQDIEWARAGRGDLPRAVPPDHRAARPEAGRPTDWPVPDRTALYFRASIVEQLPIRCPRCSPISSTAS